MSKKSFAVPAYIICAAAVSLLAAGCGNDGEETPSPRRTATQPSGTISTVAASSSSGSAARDLPRYTPVDERLAAWAARGEMDSSSLLKNVAYRSIGPSVMSGRVVDLDVNPEDPATFYAAYASGGLWRTKNNGASFEPVFDNQAVMTIGDIAVDWRPGGAIWVGTGENNSSRSSYSGTGVYRSTDDGETWEHLGLGETHHIGRIVLHPNEPGTVWVAALGHLYSTNPERGVFKTTDGGKSWQKTLFISDRTGIIDLVIDPQNPDILYAAAWERIRHAWNFDGDGPESGIYKSEDGGEQWTRLTTEGSGFPADSGVGRIGLAVSPKDPGIVYAFLDNQNRRPPEEDEKEDALTKDAVRAMGRDAFLALDAERLTQFLDDFNFPRRYTAEQIQKDVQEGLLEPASLVEFLEDANAQLFDTPVIGAELYRSDDGGGSWRRTHEDFLDGIYFSYGYYFGEVRVQAQNPDHVYIMGVPLLKSEDGGATFARISKANVHADHHALWLHPDRPGYMVNGNDGGINITADDGETWINSNTPAVGQFYAIAVDMAKPYNVYGGLQDNGVWAGPSTYEAGRRWLASGNYPYKRVLGGDGMQIAIDSRDNATVYTGFQFGFYSRINRDTGTRTSVKPSHELGERPLRFNWQTPIELSSHNQDIFYIGTNKVYRSLKKGDDPKAISEDLTRGGKPGNVPYGTLTALEESPLTFGLLYAGSDDGLVHVSRDGGHSWQDISRGLPPDLWVSRIVPSHHEKGRVYVALNGYRYDDFRAYLYRSEDYGASWQELGRDLPAEPINAVAEDPENAKLVYVGTDHAIYVTLDGGANWMGMNHGLPGAPVHDLVVHPRERELVAGTHGRSIYIADVVHVQELTPELMSDALHLFDISSLTHNQNWGRLRFAWSEPNTPEVEIAWYANAARQTILRITAGDGLVVHERTAAADRGLNYLTYDLSVDSSRVAAYRQSVEGGADSTGAAKASEPKLKKADDGNLYLLPGEYKVVLEAAGASANGTLNVKARKRPKRGVSGEAGRQ